MPVTVSTTAVFESACLLADRLLPENPSESKDLQQYLTRLESMLNIADDICDSRNDKAAVTIRLSMDLPYYGQLSSRRLLTCLGPLLRHPLRFPRHFLQFSLRYLYRGMA